MNVLDRQAQIPATKTRFSLGKVLITISLLLLILMTIGLGGYLFLAASKTTAKPIRRAKIMLQEVIPATQNDQEQVAALGKLYMDSLLQQHYNVMWSMLHPQVQKIWPNETAFITYWKLRFHGYTLQSFSSGNASQLSFWVDPETMVQYRNVYTIPISLQLQTQLPAAQLAKLAPQFQHPDQLFKNLPFIVQRANTTTVGEKASWLVLNGGPADLEAPILPPSSLAYRTVAVPILMYHHVANVFPTTNLLDRSLTVTPATFTGQLDYMKKAGYHTITFNQLMDALYYGGPLPKKPVILTFDDGYDDGYNYALPILKAHGFSGMFYIITGKVGWRGQASWNQLSQMLANGMQIGSHTVHHVDMGTTYLSSPALALQEAQVAQVTLQSHLGIPIQHFCYPNGGPFKGHDLLLQKEVVALLAKNGYISATTDPGPTGIVQSSLSPLVLLRLRVDGRESLFQFDNTLPLI